MSDERALFTGTAQYYAKYRPKYPPEFFEYLESKFNLDGKGRLLDLGCGTGQITIPLAHLFEESIGLDPEEEMLEEASKEAEREKVTNIRWVCDKAENVNSDLGVFHLATMGKSFHWMDQKTVLENIYQVLEPNGGVVIIAPIGKYDGMGWRVDVDPWCTARTEVIKKYAGQKRRAGAGFYEKAAERFDKVLRASSFGECEEWDHEYSRTLTLDEAVNEMYSTSAVSRAISNSELPQFDRDVRAVLLQAEPSGVFVEHIPLQVLSALKR